eukprot:TRINITY_DN3603_c0_g2_i1.p1 TRINITY_DN3603_c0_g2~~TRINITY_DN3603_c0_g2_i1.p1  ORF type:complete len:1022 (-),score=191.05 TRINITY_DN3603_c0_g2_i1:95-3160(-)
MRRSGSTLSAPHAPVPLWRSTSAGSLQLRGGDSRTSSRKSWAGWGSSGAKKSKRDPSSDLAPRRGSGPILLGTSQFLPPGWTKTDEQAVAAAELERPDLSSDRQAGPWFPPWLNRGKRTSSSSPTPEVIKGTSTCRERELNSSALQETLRLPADCMMPAAPEGGTEKGTTADSACSNIRSSGAVITPSSLANKSFADESFQSMRCGDRSMAGSPTRGAERLSMRSPLAASCRSPGPGPERRGFQLSPLSTGDISRLLPPVSPAKSSTAVVRGEADGSKGQGLDWSTLSPDTSAQISGIDLLAHDRKQPPTPAMSPIRNQSSPFLARCEEVDAGSPVLNSSATCLFVDDVDKDADTSFNSFAVLSPVKRRPGGWEHSLQQQQQMKEVANKENRNPLQPLLPARQRVDSDESSAESLPPALQRADVDWLMSMLSADDQAAFEQADWIEDCQRKFRVLDTKRVGSLTAEEFKSAAFLDMFSTLQLELLNCDHRISAPAASIENLVAIFDTDSDGRLSQENFTNFAKFYHAWRLRQFTTSSGSAANLGRRGRREALPPALPRNQNLAPLVASHPSSTSRAPLLGSLQSQDMRPSTSSSGSLSQSGAGQGKPPLLRPLSKPKMPPASAGAEPTDRLAESEAIGQAAPAQRSRRSRSRTGKTPGQLPTASPPPRGGSRASSRGSSRGSSRAGSSRTVATSSRKINGSLRTWRDNSGRSLEEFEMLQMEALEKLLVERQKQQQQQIQQKKPQLQSQLPAELTNAVVAEEVYHLVQGVLNRENMAAFTKEDARHAANHVAAQLAAEEAAAAAAAAAEADATHDNSAVEEGTEPSLPASSPPDSRATTKESKEGSPPRREQSGISPLTERVMAVLRRLSETSGLALADIMGQVLWKQRRNEVLQQPRQRAVVESTSWIETGAFVKGAEEVFNHLAASDGGRMRRITWLKVVNFIQRNPVLRSRVHHGDADRLFHSMVRRSEDESRSINLYQFMQLLMQLVETTGTHPWMVFLAVSCHAEHLKESAEQARP